MRPQTACRPDPLHRRRGHPSTLGHRPARPVRRPGRRLMQRQTDDLLDLLGVDRRLGAATRPHRGEVLQTILRKPRPPVGYRRRRHLNLAGDPRVREPVASHQQHSRSQHVTMGSGPDRISFSKTDRCSSVTGSAGLAVRIPHPTTKPHLNVRQTTSWKTRSCINSDMPCRYRGVPDSVPSPGWITGRGVPERPGQAREPENLRKLLIEVRHACHGSPVRWRLGRPGRTLRGCVTPLLSPGIGCVTRGRRRSDSASV